MYGQDFAPGDVIDISLAPYETIVLSIGTKQPVSDDVFEPGKKPPYIKVNFSKRTLLLENNKESKADLASCGSEEKYASSDDFKLDLDIGIEVQAPQADVLIFMEGESAIPQLFSSVMIDGVESAVLYSSSGDGWAASTLPAVEHWLILQAPIPGGKHEVQITAVFSHTVKHLSAWVWASKPGRMLHLDNPDILPQPEKISLDAVVIIEPLNEFPPLQPKSET
jgi:hypothetical protein